MRFFFSLLLLLSQTTFGQVVGDQTPFISSVAPCDYATAWAASVVSNGGASPSGGTKTAINHLICGLNSVGVWSKMISVNGLVPDSQIANQTPLLQGSGYPMWTNSGISSGNVTVNGLTGDGAHILDTGIVPSSLSATNAGMTIYVYKYGRFSDIYFGSAALGIAFELGPSLFDCWDVATARLASAPVVGIFSGSRTSTNANALSYSSTLRTTYLLSSGVGNTSVADNFSIGRSIYLLGEHANGGALSFPSTATLSFAAVHQGLSSIETSNLLYFVQAFRVELGGGFNDISQDWSQRVIVNSGAAISSNTSNAVNTFCSGVFNNNLILQIGLFATSLVVTDNLIAASTPIFRGIGADPWVAHNLVSGDLTINGITGNASNKYLDSGFNPISQTWVGQSCYAYNAPNTAANGFDEGNFDGVNILGIQAKYLGNTTTINGSGGGGIVVTSPGNGYYSDERTGSAVRKAYFAKSGTSWAQIGATDTGAFTAYPNTSCFVFGLSSSGTLFVPGNDTISFVSWHTGLSTSDAQNLYNLAQAFRVSEGGGFR